MKPAFQDPSAQIHTAVCDKGRAKPRFALNLSLDDKGLGQLGVRIQTYIAWAQLLPTQDFKHGNAKWQWKHLEKGLFVLRPISIHSCLQYGSGHRLTEMSIIDVDAFLATKVSSDLEESVFILVHLSLLGHTSAGVRDISIQQVKSDAVWV